ncbi:MAG TPA: sugar ABC transporter substrate-binding protein [Solirubrobacterales bacterium]|nr:sugar ABC transporter substrate-binding protein [Solirubrobacterales bacterium]
MPQSAWMKRGLFVAFALVAIAAVVAGCGGGGSTTGGNTEGGGEESNGGGGEGVKIALLLPENETPRYETNDKPAFEKAVEEQCSGCQVTYFNAAGDVEKQASQGEAALTQGAEVMVVDPMDSKAAAAIVEKAHAQEVPVVSYDRLIENSEVAGYVSFDNERVGEQQAEALSEKLKEDGSPKGPIIMINGDPADPNAALFKKGAHNGFEEAGVEIAKEYDTPGWTAENAQREAQQAITALGKEGFAGIYAANDDTAGGAIAAMKGAGINPSEKPVTGQDSTVAGLQRILVGQQYMTIFKPIVPEAEIAAEMAISLGETGEVSTKEETEEINNGKADVPSVLLTSTPVMKNNIKSTVIAEEFVSPSELCEGPYAAACKEQGISG